MEDQLKFDSEEEFEEEEEEVVEQDEQYKYDEGEKEVIEIEVREVMEAGVVEEAERGDMIMVEVGEEILAKDTLSKAEDAGKAAGKDFTMEVEDEQQSEMSDEAMVETDRTRMCGDDEIIFGCVCMYVP